MTVVVVGRAGVVAWPFHEPRRAVGLGPGDAGRTGAATAGAGRGTGGRTRPAAPAAEDARHLVGPAVAGLQAESGRATADEARRPAWSPRDQPTTPGAGRGGPLSPD